MEADKCLICESAERTHEFKEVRLNDQFTLCWTCAQRIRGETRSRLPEPRKVDLVMEEPFSGSAGFSC